MVNVRAVIYMVHVKQLDTLLLLGLVLSPTSTGRAQDRLTPGSPDEVVRRFQAAQQNMRDGHFDVAIGQFKEVLRLRPDLVEARVNLGLAYHAVGDYALAVSALSEAQRERPDLLPASLFLGFSYLKLRSADKAVRPLRHAVTLDPSNQEARRALAQAELALGDYSKAAGEFRRLSEAQRDKAEAWFTLGQDYLEMGKQLTTDLSRHQDSAWSFRLAGDVLGERRLWNDAAFAYRQAIKRDPAEPGLHASLAEALMRADRTGEAESEFRVELSRDPFEPSVLVGVAELELARGSVPPAIERVEKVWKLAPELLLEAAQRTPAVSMPQETARRMATELESAPPGPAREFLLCVLFQVAGDDEQAAKEELSLESSVKSAASSGRESASLSRAACENHQERLCAEFLVAQKQLRPADLLRLGRALFILSQDEAASDAFAAVLSRTTTSPEAMYWLSRSYLRLADKCFKRLAASYPDSWRTHELKAEALHLRHADKDAILEYQAAERLNPNDPKIHEALGEVLLDENSPAEGRAEVETALRLNPAAARSLYLLGRLYVSQREPEKGIPYLQGALRYDPGLIEARAVLGKAYLRSGKAAPAAAQLEQAVAIDRYGDLHHLLYQAYRQEGKTQLAAQALARSEELRRKSATDDQAKIRPANEE